MDQGETEVITGLIQEWSDREWSIWSNACETHDLTLGKTAQRGPSRKPASRRTSDDSTMLEQFLHFLGQQAPDLFVAVHVPAIHTDFRISGKIPD